MTGTLGSVSGWAAVDWLRTAQTFAGITAGIVSVVTLIIIAPRALDALMALPKKWRLFKDFLRGRNTL